GDSRPAEGVLESDGAAGGFLSRASDLQPDQRAAASGQGDHGPAERGEVGEKHRPRRGDARSGTRMIVCKSPAELERMKAANQLVAEVLAELRENVEPGVTTGHLDALAEDRIRAAGGEPAFKGYHGFPASIC